jgi:hypothetical protein
LEIPLFLQLGELTDWWKRTVDFLKDPSVSSRINKIEPVSAARKVDIRSDRKSGPSEWELQFMYGGPVNLSHRSSFFSKTADQFPAGHEIKRATMV